MVGANSGLAGAGSKYIVPWDGATLGGFESTPFLTSDCGRIVVALSTAAGTGIIMLAGLEK